MPDLDDRISEASGEFARPDQSDLAMPGQTSTGVSARRSRLRRGGTVPMTATVGLVLVVIAAVTLLGWLRTTHSGPQSAVPPPSPAVSPAAILQPGQFVGVIPPSRGEKQYAWVMSADGQPVRRLTQALGPVGLTGDKTQALIQQYGISGCSGLPYALVSLADGSLTAPFPGRSDISGMAIGGHMVAGISIPVAASKPIADGYWCEGWQPPRLVLRNLRTRHRRHLPPSPGPRQKAGRDGRQPRRTLGGTARLRSPRSPGLLPGAPRRRHRASTPASQPSRGARRPLSMRTRQRTC